jgi:lipopolysaccharide/colanic/teichoic acid biosynthesis glycosyltransferase
MSTVVAVGHEAAASQLIKELRREPHHGLQVVAACLAGEPSINGLDGVPVVGDLDETASAVRNLIADTVAILSCPEIDGMKLRTLAWELQKTGTELCVASAQLDVAGPRTTVRPTAGLTLLHVDHPQLSRPRQMLKDMFDRCAAAPPPPLLAIAMTIQSQDKGPALFTQMRVGKDGEPFKIYKFLTIVVGAEARLAEIREKNESDGVLFKSLTESSSRSATIHASPPWVPGCGNGRLTSGHSSSSTPRLHVPGGSSTRVARGGGEICLSHARRRLVVKPALTGMWQVNGRSDLSWEETVRLDCVMCRTGRSLSTFKSCGRRSR